MRLILNVFLLALIALLAYMLFNSISTPIKFQEEKENRKEQVVNRLTDVRTCQELFKTITGEYAGSFDTLKLVLENDSIPFIKLTATDVDDVYESDTTYSAAIDSIRAMAINLDSIGYIPFSENKMWDIQADTLTYQQVLVPVVEVGTRWKNFMGPYADNKYRKYDDSYNPNDIIKFGDLNSPNVSGNWN